MRKSDTPCMRDAVELEFVGEGKVAGTSDMTEATAELNRFRSLLRTLFEFDSSDLDFGIYRILKEKRGPIEDFLEKRLPQIVDEAFEEYGKAEHEALARRLDELQLDIQRTLGPDAIDSEGN